MWYREKFDTSALEISNGKTDVLINKELIPILNISMVVLMVSFNCKTGEIRLQQNFDSRGFCSNRSRPKSFSTATVKLAST